jgi:hypothetical protein
VSATVAAGKALLFCAGGHRQAVGWNQGKGCLRCDQERLPVEIAARLAAIEPELASEQIIEAVRAATPGKGELRRLARLCAENQAWMTSGESGTLPVGARLLRELIARGARAAQAPRCADCGRAVPLPSVRPDGERVCDPCRQRASAEECGRCGRVKRVSSRLPTGQAVCANCVRVDPARHERCSRCRRVGPVAGRAGGLAVCVSCYQAPEHECGHCGRLRPIVNRRDGVPTCQQCQARKPGNCSRCQKVAPLWGTKITAGECGRCWHARTGRCARCSTDRPLVDHATEGRVCERCYRAVNRLRICGICRSPGRIRKRATALEPDICDRCWRGPTLRCSACGATRRCPNGTRTPRPLCVFCLATLDAGIPDTGAQRSPRTRRCQDCRKRSPRVGRRCPPCAVEHKLSELIDSSPVSAQLGPLRDALAASDPVRLLRWLGERGGEQRLQPLLRGEVELSHEGLDQLPASKAVEFLRDLLIAAGALEPVERYARVFERWTRDHLEQVTDPTDHRILHEFATWRLLHDLRQRGRRSELTYSALTLAKTRLRLACELCGWAREQALTLGELRQPEIDEWVTSGPSTRREIEIFINWTTSKRYSTKLTLPRTRQRSMPAEIGADERWALAKRLLHDEDVELADRVAGLLILFYGQPLTRVLALKRDAVRLDRDYDAWIKLGRHPTRLQPPLNRLALQLTERRTVPGVAPPLAGSEWLFVGHRPGRPFSVHRMYARLRALGLPVRAARSTTLLHLAARVPAPILADLLGLHPQTANAWVEVAGGRWSSYAASAPLARGTP